MGSFVSIRSKLISYTMLLIGGTFLILLSVIVASNIISLRRNMEKAQNQIRDALFAKGKLLAKNNSLAMDVMAQDNAFTSIQGLVASTVADDNDLVYGIYMDRDLNAWVFADAENPKGIPKSYEPLSDSISLWARALFAPDYKEFTLDTISVIEFAAPVGAPDEILGFIRYGISTASMKTMIGEARANARASMLQAVIIITATGLFSLLIGYMVLQKLASRITLPIGALVESSRIISEGNYDVAVHPQSNDEIGRFAEHFESMRKTIKRYTDHLQILIDEKMQQVKDILNNIDQGLFTVNLDGTVNNEYSVRANEILNVDDVASCSLRTLLQCSEKKEAAFQDWFKLVKRQYRRIRWAKLAKLAPVQELELPGVDGGKFVAVSYQSICDKHGNLVKIMVLALDETEKRNRDRQMAEERLQHEQDVKTILSVAHTPAEELSEFMIDTGTRLRELQAEANRHRIGVIRQRERFPEPEKYTIGKEQIDRMYRDLHTIKGNCGSYDFEHLASLAHEAEGKMELLREPVTDRRGEVLVALMCLLDKMIGALDDIHGKIRLISGSEDEVTVRIPEVRVNRIIELGTTLITTENATVKTLATECVQLSWKPAKSLLRKYQKLAYKTARRLGKNIRVKIVDENSLFPPEFIAEHDEALIHLVRNAVAHGIESSEIRDDLGKGIGRITLALEQKEGLRSVIVSDDGHGFNVEKITEKAVAGGVLSEMEAQKLSVEEKLQLLYRGGVSTSDELTEVSGRGMGMQIAYRDIAARGGILKITTNFGKGASVSVSFPDGASVG